MLAYDYRNDTLYYLAIPKSFFLDTRNKFYIRPDRDCIDLLLSSDTVNLFQDVHGCGGNADFYQYLVAIQRYENVISDLMA